MNEIQKLNPKVVGCSCKSSSMLLTGYFLEDLRNNFPNFKHILGGSQVAGYMKNADELLLKDYIDAVNLDEGEISLASYFRTVVEKDTSELIPGVVYKKDGRIIRGGPVIPVKNLNDIPFPDFSDFNLNDYEHPCGLCVLPSYMSRGCINRCIYCTTRNYMKPFRFRSGKRVFEEIQHLKQQHPEINYIRMCDNLANASIKELEIFCDLMIEAKLEVKWNLENAGIRKEMRTPLYKKLKKAGCSLIAYGVETSSQRLLAEVGKDIAKGVDTVQVLKECKRAGIYTSINIMFGLPGETEEDFKNLMEFLKKSHRFFNMVSPSIGFCEFFPGSDGNEYPQKYGLDLSKGPLFWETIDRTNTYPIRMKRFELFSKMVRDYHLDNVYNVVELPNKHKLLFRYYFIGKEYDKALEEYDQIPLEERTSELKKMHSAIKNNNFTANISSESRPLRNILLYGKTFEETFILATLRESLENLEKANIFEDVFLRGWKRKLRALAHRIIGYDKIDKKINSAYLLMKIMDEKLKSYITSHADADSL